MSRRFRFFRTRSLIAHLLATAAIAVTALPAAAAPISATNFYNFRDNNFGLLPGPARDIIVFGAFTVDPNGGAGTTATYRQTDTVLGTDVTGVLPWTPYAPYPTVFETIVPWSPGLTGAWDFTFTNGSDTLNVTTTAMGDVAPVPLAENVQIVGTGPRPTVTWTPPPAGVDTVAVYVFEKFSPTTFDVLHFGFGSVVDPLVGAWTVPEVLDSGGGLEAGRDYAFTVLFEDRDAQGVTVSRSLHAVDYRMAPVPEPATWLALAAGLAALWGSSGRSGGRRRVRAPRPLEPSPAPVGTSLLPDNSSTRSTSRDPIRARFGARRAVCTGVLATIAVAVSTGLVEPANAEPMCAFVSGDEFDRVVQEVRSSCRSTSKAGAGASCRETPRTPITNRTGDAAACTGSSAGNFDTTFSIEGEVKQWVGVWAFRNTCDRSISVSVRGGGVPTVDSYVQSRDQFGVVCSNSSEGGNASAPNVIKACFGEDKSPRDDVRCR